MPDGSKGGRAGAALRAAVRDSARDRLARLLDDGRLARVVPQLAPELLHQLIRHRGVEACSGLLALATPEQLAAVLDLDLWRSASPGTDERFDGQRFGEWLEALVASDEGAAARILSGIDARLVTAGLSRYVRVFDPAACPRTGWAADDETDRPSASFGGFECELGGYVVRARTSEAWDAITTVLLALEVHNAEYFHAVMRGCRRLSNSGAELDGLDALYAAPEQLLHDVRMERQRRQSEQAYLAPADARAFLQLARQRSNEGKDASPGSDHIALDYLRGDARAEGVPSAPRTAGAASLPPANAARVIEQLVEALAEEGLVPERPRALLPGAADESPDLAHMRALMEHARHADASAYGARSRELAFLANALVAGCSLQSRPFTLREASDAAVATCNLGLEYWPVHWPRRGVRDSLPPANDDASVSGARPPDHDLVTAFKVGWAVLHELSMTTAQRLIEILSDLRCADIETQVGLHALRRELLRQRDRGTPWRASDALDAIATVDVAAWTALLGLLSECPVVPAALTATLERRTKPVSATAFDFISTKRQLHEVHAFLAKLLDILIA